MLFLALTISCSDDEKPEVVEASPYSWQESNLSPNGLFTNAVLEIGEDGSLYACGIPLLNKPAAFYKLPGPMSSTWTMVGETHYNGPKAIQDFAVYQGSIYYHLPYDTLFKLEGTETKEILADGIADIEVCQDELAIIGGGINVSNEDCTFASYDGNTFKPLAKDWALTRLIPANGKVYWPGFPSVVYDGKSLSQLNFYGDFWAVDGLEQMYSVSTFNNRLTLSRQSNYGQREVLGDQVTGIGEIFRGLEFFDGTIFLVGVDTLRGYSKVYFLKGDKWIEVPTDHVIYDVIVYNNRLITSSVDGKFYEIVKD
jgi:hypothetical protein